MKRITLRLKVWLWALALLFAGASAKTISAEINILSYSGGSTITFTFSSDSSVDVSSLGQSDYWHYTDFMDSMDLFLQDMADPIPEITPSTLILYTDSPGFWIPLDTSKLDFTRPLELDDSTFFEQKEEVVIASSNELSEAFFFFQTNKGKYAFCHSQSVDTSYFSGENHTGDVIYTFSRMYLACQVQEDGTPTFDSIPQYKEPPVALPPLRLRTMQKQRTPSAPYRVNGTSAGTSRATSIRVGKETTIRDQ